MNKNINLRQSSKIYTYEKYKINENPKKEFEDDTLIILNINHILYFYPKILEAIKIKQKKIIVSVASYGKRIPFITATLNSILCQTMKPIKIILVVAFNDKKNLNSYVKRFIVINNIELIIAKKNFKPHNKYYYPMVKYKNAAILTIDDDVIYEPNLIKSFFNLYLQYPNCVSAGRVHKIKYYENGKPYPYLKWKYYYNKKNKKHKPSFSLFATGVGGIFYPPDILGITEKNVKEILQTIYVDDIYLKYLENKKRIKIVMYPNNILFGCERNETVFKKTALYNINVKKNRNDYFIKALNIVKIKE